MIPPDTVPRSAPQTLRGIAHVHSRYSFDGKHTLADIAEAARRAGFSFVCMSEHSDTLDAAQVDALARECDALSSPSFVMIPGVEFTCEGGIHLLGLGVRSYSPSTDCVDLDRFIREQGAVSVLAHPMRKSYRIPEGLLRTLDGIEIWNCAYDGSVVPNARALDLYAQARLEHPKLVAFVGCDLHRLSNLGKIALEIRSPSLDEKSVLNALKGGSFRAVSRLCVVSGRTHARAPERAGIRALRAAYSTAQRIRARLRGEPSRGPRHELKK